MLIKTEVIKKKNNLKAVMIFKASPAKYATQSALDIFPLLFHLGSLLWECRVVISTTSK